MLVNSKIRSWWIECWQNCQNKNKKKRWKRERERKKIYDLIRRQEDKKKNNILAWSFCFCFDVLFCPFSLRKALICLLFSFTKEEEEEESCFLFSNTTINQQEEEEEQEKEYDWPQIVVSKDIHLKKTSIEETIKKKNNWKRKRKTWKTWSSPNRHVWSFVFEKNKKNKRRERERESMKINAQTLIMSWNKWERKLI